MTLLTKNCGVALDVKAVGDDGTFEGYGSIFGNVDSDNEIVMPGAFTQSLVDAKRGGRSIKMLWQHDRTQPIGVWDDMAEDSKGLWVQGRLLIKQNVPRADEAYALLKAEAMDGMSIGYRTLDADPHPTKPGIIQLKKLLLREVSLVTFASNDRARVETVKHLLDAGGMPTIREFQGTLRELGFSKSKAEAMASACAPHLRGEPEAKADDELSRFLKTMLA